MNNVIDERSTSLDDDDDDDNVEYKQYSRTHVTRLSSGSTSSSTTNGTKRTKDIPPCFVCGAEAHGYNFDQITCESCKAFFRRNALKSMEKFRCRNNEKCVITVATRKRCKRCRLLKCFQVKMRKDWILSDEEKIIKREKVVRNRLLKQKAQRITQQQTTNDFNQTNSNIVVKSSTIPFALLSMHSPPDQKLYDRQQCFLGQLSYGYQSICQQYPQPNKFLHRNTIISQMEDFDVKITLIKDITRELTQMTTLRLLNFFNLIPEFQLLTQQEKTAILIQNMLPVFMFHGALTYNNENDTFVDHTTADQPYDAKYLFYVYGSKIYTDFLILARALISTICQSINDKRTDENYHTLFLLLMVVLLFSSKFQTNSSDEQITKFSKIHQNYMDITSRFLHDRFGFAIGQRMFQQLVPLLTGLQKLCSTLANVNLCEMVEDENRVSSSPYSNTTSNSTNNQFSQSSSSSSSRFNSTLISGTSHLNELQKENRSPLNSTSFSSTHSFPSILSNTTTTTLTRNSHI
ncbi:hypothetical protein I4U23_026413 [Adineta vaga]|nr:hypothetical protein I4U23_026413 [Adineta vaga]